MNEITVTASSSYAQFLLPLSEELGISIEELIQSAFELGFDKIVEEKDLLKEYLHEN